MNIQSNKGFNSNEDTGELLTRNKRSNMTKIMVIVLVALITLLLIIAGIYFFLLHKNRDIKQLYSDQNVELSEIYNAYADVLIKNEYVIRNYDWQEDAHNQCIAVMDLNDDDIPELIFFTRDTIADLHVYTYINDSVVEYTYDNSISMNNQGNTPQGSLFNDIHAAAGTRYVIYTGKEIGTLYIAYSMGDESMYYHSNRYVITDGQITLEREVANKYGPYLEGIGQADYYYINGEKVNNAIGISEFKVDTDAFNTLIMYSGNDNNMNVFKKIEENNPVAMAYDDALRFLQN